MNVNLAHQQQLRQAAAFCGAGDYASALSIARKLAKLYPSNPNVQMCYATSLRGLDYYDDARRVLEKLAKIQTSNPGIHNDLCITYQRLGRWDEALRSITRAAELAPTNPYVAGVRADCLFALGQLDECRMLISSCDERGMVSAPLAMVGAKLALRSGDVDAAVARVEAVASQDSLSPIHRAAMLYALGDLKDKQGEIDEAFYLYVQANTVRDMPFDAAHHAQRIGQLIASWSAEAMQSMPRGRLDGSRCVFIVGMPRSATSLVEQVLASHPDVVGGGELVAMQRAVHALSPAPAQLVSLMTDTSKLNQVSVDKAARAYLDAIRHVSSSALHVTDKMPSNFFHLGLISRIFAPGKEPRIVHCVRNPIDTCWSCYRQNFTSGSPFAYDLANLGAFYREYLHVMDHWKRVLPIAIHEVVYEQLLEEPERQVRALLDHLDLAWDDACMKFHENKRVVLTASQDQVRQKLYTTSRGGWKRYEKHLGPLIEALGDAVSV
ncbi:MAG: sulfotransferase [Phycisphaeraceae bacterium]|nr:sulfotransferase [Phycisphaerales bacterium]MCB9859897.1 sulfotransferase [Phycisphaeraceae bacterium]